VVEEAYDPSRIISGADYPVARLGKQEFEELSDTDNPQGIMAVCRMPDEIPTEKLAARSGVIVATDAIQDPGNLGTMIRTSVWFGAVGFICGTGTVDPWHPKVVRSTAGATGAIPWLSDDLEGLFTRLEAEGWEVLLLDGGKGSVPLPDVSKQQKTVLVVGNEANGINPELMTSNRQRVKIEGTPGTVESLNAAIALGIAMYELRDF
jgi:RNA methyltransferase, TrmH family